MISIIIYLIVVTPFPLYIIGKYLINNFTNTTNDKFPLLLIYNSVVIFELILLYIGFSLNVYYMYFIIILIFMLMYYCIIVFITDNKNIVSIYTNRLYKMQYILSYIYIASIVVIYIYNVLIKAIY